jgi:hypothetical protein
MRSKSWFARSVRVCAAISGLAAVLAAQTPAPVPAPLLVVLDPAEAGQWRTWTASRNWRVLAAPPPADKRLDNRILALAGAVKTALAEPGVDAARVYLIGRGEAASTLFYVAARTPDLWTAAAAIGGSPQAAIDTARFFAANFTNLPLLWVGASAGDAPLAAKVKAAQVNLEFLPGAGVTAATVLDWFASKQRDAIPETVDCETTSPAFASCYWIRMTRFDAASRNDVLPVSRVQPGSGAVLDLGGFGFSRDDAEKGVLVIWLPDKYNGPLKLKDRLVAFGGKPIANAREYQETLEKTVEEKPVVVTVERGGDRVRLETRIVLPKRDEAVTARVQGSYHADQKTIEILSRTVVELRVTVPEAWAGATLNWNGTALAQAGHAGCWLLVEEKQLQSARPCL